jgi:hypothetical protein
MAGRIAVNLTGADPDKSIVLRGKIKRTAWGTKGSRRPLTFQRSGAGVLDTGKAIVEALSTCFTGVQRVHCVRYSRRGKGREVRLEDRAFHDFLPQQQ